MHAKDPKPFENTDPYIFPENWTAPPPKGIDLGKDFTASVNKPAKVVVPYKVASKPARILALDIIYHGDPALPNFGLYGVHDLGGSHEKGDYVLSMTAPYMADDLITAFEKKASTPQSRKHLIESALSCVNYLLEKHGPATLEKARFFGEEYENILEDLDIADAKYAAHVVRVPDLPEPEWTDVKNFIPGLK